MSHSETRLQTARTALAQALAERDDLLTALSGQDVQEALLGVSQALGALGERVLSERLDQLMHAVRVNREATMVAMREMHQGIADALIAYEDAFTDHLTALLLTSALAERQQDRRIDVLDAIVLGSPLAEPTPGEPPDDVSAINPSAPIERAAGEDEPPPC